MKLKLLCAAAGIDCPAERQNDEVRAIECNSSRVREHCLFVCIRGQRTDGHKLIDLAIAAGAKWILTDPDADPRPISGITYLKTKDTRRAFACLCNAWYNDPCKRLKMIGVTGTNGKTTVTSMIAAILTGSGHSCGLIGTLGCFLDGQKIETAQENPLANMTTPEPLALYRTLAEMVARGAEYAVMEVSSHALAQGRVAPIRFAVGVFTNLTPEHLDFHETMAQYASEKAKLMEKSDLSIINLDDAYADQMIRFSNCARTCSTQKNADYRADNLEFQSAAGVSYRLRTPNDTVSLTCPIPGRFTVTNTVQAFATAIELGIAPTEIIHTLAGMRGVKGRMERVLLPPDADITVLIDYAHTPDALEKLLQTARSLTRARVCVLFGCGGDRDREKRPVMGRIASALADRVILTSDNSRSEDRDGIIKEILSGVDPLSSFEVIPDRREAIIQAILTAEENDLILLAGKGHEEYEIDAAGRHRFSEIEIANEAYLIRERIKNKDGGYLP